MPSPEPKPADRCVTILVVEDEPVLLDLARLILEGSGYRVLCAKSKAETIEAWKQAQGEIDLLFTDMLLPEAGSGRQLADLFRHEHGRLKIIFTSAFAETEYQDDLNRHPGSHFLQKPYTKLDLTQAVQKCLEEELS